jgi:D-alanine transaminase
MPRIAYVNGRFLPHREAAVHVEDRGYQLADGVYEVMAVRRGAIGDEVRHLERLGRSLAELRIPWPMHASSLRLVMRELIRRNRLADGALYLQITRGVAPRDHAFPAAARPSIVMTLRRLRVPDPATVERGIAVATVPDIRWGRCDIKSIALLANVLAKQAAREKGAYEAWLVDREGYVTEGSSTNAWIVSRRGEIVTRQLDSAILSGVTRKVLLDYARRQGIAIVERRFSLAEAKEAAEAFLTSTVSIVLPIVRIDDSLVGEGKPGKTTLELRRLYLEAAAAP